MIHKWVYLWCEYLSLGIILHGYLRCIQSLHDLSHHHWHSETWLTVQSVTAPASCFPISLSWERICNRQFTGSARACPNRTFIWSKNVTKWFINECTFDVNTHGHLHLVISFGTLEFLYRGARSIIVHVHWTHVWGTESLSSYHCCEFQKSGSLCR